jgi:methylglutaconyl-CoA hydratase
MSASTSLCTYNCRVRFCNKIGRTGSFFPEARLLCNTLARSTGIAEGYRDAYDDNDVRVIVLTGAGDKAFCAGADLLNSAAAFAMDFSRPNADYADLLRLSQNATKPAIARVGGVCMAGGMGLLCMTDMAVAADHVVFGLPEVKVGVFPMQVMSLLQEIAPRRLVNEWALTGEPFDAKAAQAAGPAQLRGAGNRT